MAEISPARDTAYRILCRLHEKTDDPTPLPVLLEESGKRLPPRDAAFAAEIVYGVLRGASRLFAALSPFLSKPEGLPFRLRIILSMAAFELAELDSVPARATLDQAVCLARKQFGKGLSGLTNAVLRNACRANTFAKEALTGNDAVKQPEPQVKHIALHGSLPLWLAECWSSQYGPETALRLARLSSLRPRPGLRLNANAGEEHLSTLRAHLKNAGAVFFDEYGCLLPFTSAIESDKASEGGCAAPETLEQPSPDTNKPLLHLVTEAHRTGLVSRQGAASQKLARAVAEKMRAARDKRAPDFSFWDACCGRGGKSCALREAGVAPLLCSDPSERRLAFLREEMIRLGLDNMEILSGEAQKIAAPRPRHFDGILLDAPCSGTGTLARNPELRLRLMPEKLQAASALQQELLDAAWTALRPGGLLVYATCAVNRNENEEQVSAFLARTGDARLEEQELTLPSSPTEEGQDILFHAFLRKGGIC